MYVYIYTCIYIYMHIYKHVYIHTCMHLYVSTARTRSILRSSKASSKASSKYKYQRRTHAKGIASLMHSFTTLLLYTLFFSCIHMTYRTYSFSTAYLYNCRQRSFTTAYLYSSIQRSFTTACASRTARTRNAAIFDTSATRKSASSNHAYSSGAPRAP